MVRIRLRRVGAKHQPSYRIVAADKESPRDGRFLEVLGHYNPRTEPSTIKVDEARLFHWMKNGAQPSDAVSKVLSSLGTWDRWERFKAGDPIEELLEEASAAAIEVDPRTRRDDLIGKRPKKKRKKEEQEAAPEPVAEEAQAESETEAEPEPEAEPEAAEAESEAEPEAKAEPEVAEAEAEPEAEAEAEGGADAEAESPEAEAEPEAAEAEAEPEAAAEGEAEPEAEEKEAEDESDDANPEQQPETED